MQHQKDLAFAEMLYTYASTTDANVQRHMEEDFPEILITLRERAIGALMAHVYSTTIDGRIPDSYFQLIRDIFGSHKHWCADTDILRATAGTHILQVWENFLTRIVTKQLTVHSYCEAELHLLHMCSDISSNDHVLLDFDPTVFVDTFKSVLTTILPREEMFLKKRYGIDRDAPMTYTAIGKEKNVSGSRIGEICANALRKLRGPSRTRRLLTLIKTPAKQKIRIAELERRLHEMRTEFEAFRGSPPYHVEDLDKKLSETYLSPRTTNCLYHANIRYIGDLVKNTDAALLKLSGIGKKSVKEIKEMLETLGLSLCMNIDRWKRHES